MQKFDFVAKFPRGEGFLVANSVTVREFSHVLYFIFPHNEGG